MTHLSYGTPPIESEPQDRATKENYQLDPSENPKLARAFAVASTTVTHPLDHVPVVHPAILV
jgi:hypothetical protein